MSGEIPFPVEAVYRVAPDLRRLPPGEGHFCVDAEWPHYLESKLELLEREAEDCRVMVSDAPKLLSQLRKVARLVAGEYPDLVQAEGDAFRFARLGLILEGDGSVKRSARSRPGGRGANVGDSTLDRVRRLLESRSDPVARLADALALTVQEDFVLLEGPPGRDRATLLHVCFPSHWPPEERRGASFLQLHRPVPDRELLDKASLNVVKAMLERGPFVRFVWSLTRSAGLDAHPKRLVGTAKPADWDERPLLESLHFRAERQTTRSLEGAALFTIRIFVTALNEVLDPERARTMASSIRSMSAPVLEYKGLTHIRERLLAELDALAASSAVRS